MKKSALRFGSFKSKVEKEDKLATIAAENKSSEQPSSGSAKEFTKTSELNSARTSEIERYNSTQPMMKNYDYIVEEVNQNMANSNLRFSENWKAYRDNHYQKSRKRACCYNPKKNDRQVKKMSEMTPEERKERID